MTEKTSAEYAVYLGAVVVGATGACVGIIIGISFWFTPKLPKTTDADLARWGYHREHGEIVVNDDRLTVHLDGSVTDFHGDYIGRIEIKP